MNLRTHTLLVTIKPHTAFKNMFSESEYQADLKSYLDIFPYIASIHPKFHSYIKRIEANEVDENYSFLDKDLNIIRNDEIFIKKLKEDEVIHIVPAVFGGGGKRGLLPVLAIAGLGIATGGFGFGAAAGGAGAGAGAGASGGFFSGLSSAFASMPNFLQTMTVNLALAAVTSLFTTRQKPRETDQQTRENSMFGSLTNSTEPGTPIALHYGMVRVGGQLVSGYIETEEHEKDDIVKVSDMFSNDA